MVSEQERADIFLQCLDALEKGHTTLEQCILRYPEVPDLREMLAVTQTARHIAPPVMSSARKQALRNQLTSKMKSRQPKLAVPQLRSWGRWAALVPACLLAIFVSGATLLYAADSALPNDPLYGLKKTSEQVGLAFARPQSRAYVLSQTAQTRLGELVILLGRGQSIDSVFFNDVIGSLNAALAANPDIGVRTALYNQADSVLQILIVRNVDSNYINSLTTAVAAIAPPPPTPTPSPMPTVPSATPTMTFTPLSTKHRILSATPNPTRRILPATKTMVTGIRLTPYIPPTTTPFMTFTPAVVITFGPTVTPPSNDLRLQIMACVTDEGLQNSLLVKLNSNQLRAFINEVAAQTQKKIDTTCASRLIQLTTSLLIDPTQTPDPAQAGGDQSVEPKCHDKGKNPNGC